MDMDIRLIEVRVYRKGGGRNKLNIGLATMDRRIGLPTMYKNNLVIVASAVKIVAGIVLLAAIAAVSCAVLVAWKLWGLKMNKTELTFWEIFETLS